MPSISNSNYIKGAKYMKLRIILYVLNKNQKNIGMGDVLQVFGLSLAVNPTEEILYTEMQMLKIEIDVIQYNTYN